MESDGLLYNKIIKKRCVNYLSNKSVKEVLNEAKKELPDWDEIEKEFDVSDRDGKLAFLLQYVGETIVWKQKWLGDSL